MSLLKAIKAQLGLSNTPANNFTITAEADNGTLKLARGNAGATTQDILTVDASGNVLVDGNNLNLFSAKSLAASGYQKLPSGLIIQWGTAAIAATGSYVSLPIAFPNAFTAVMTSMYVAASPGTVTNNNVGVQAQADNLTRFVARCYQDSVGVARTVTWFAIGY